MKPHIYWGKTLRQSGAKLPDRHLNNVELAKAVYWFRNKGEQEFTKRQANDYLKRAMYKHMNEFKR